MSAFSLIAFANFVIFMFLFFYILSLKKYQLTLNISSALICLVLGFWNFFNMFVYMADSGEEAMSWYHAAACCMFLFPLFTFYFFVRFTKNDHLVKSIWVKILSYILPVTLIIRNLYRPILAERFVKSDITHVWAYENRSPSVWYYVILLYLLLYFIPIFVMLYQWQKKSRYRIDRKIAIGFIAIDSLVLLIGFITDLLLPVFVSVVPPAANLSLFIFAAFLWFAIRHYHMFHIRYAPTAEMIFQTIIDPIVYTDQAFHIVLINASVKRLFSYFADELTGKYLPDILPEYEQLLSSEKKSADIKLELNDGSIKYLMYNRSTVTNVKGQAAGEIFVFKDITLKVKEEEELSLINQKYAQAAEEMYYSANYDAVTGLRNRESFFRQLAAEKEKADLSGDDFALLYLDLDGFKQVNDTYGHSTGDIVLNITAKRLESIQKDNDFIARMGGDEFVILIMGAQDHESLKERIFEIKKVFADEIKVNSITQSCNISVGAALYSEAGNDTEQLIRMADNAMYSDKKQEKQQSIVGSIQKQL